MTIPRTVHGIAEGIRKKQFSADEAAAFYRGRIEKHDGRVGSYLHVYEPMSSGAADSLLRGVPLGLKDLLATKDAPTTCASRILENYRPPYDATAVARLRTAGAIFLGKLNMDEFAMGSSNENSAFKPVRNPWDLTRVPGGSSGGSAAAVAANLAPATLGSDTGGSIRQPASFCGVTGLKPTYGRISRYGLVAFASSLDQIGPFTHDARDAAIMLSVMAGHDPLDSTSASVAAEDFTTHLTGDVKGLRIGIPREYFGKGLSSSVEVAVRKALAAMESAGAHLVEISLPHTEHAIAVYYLVATAEASSNLARFDGIRYGLRVPDGSLVPTYKKTRAEGFGREVKRRIMLGTYCLSSGYYDAYYKKALEVRTLIQRDFLAAFDRDKGPGVDIIATPTSPAVAFGFGEKSADPLTMYLSDIYTISANLAGLPGISVPCGFTTPMDGGTALAGSAAGGQGWPERPAAEGSAIPSPKDGLPIGLQFIGKPFDEGTILRAADAYQGMTDWHERQPAEFAL